MMIGGEADVVKHLDPIFATLAPGRGDIPRTPGREKAGGTSGAGLSALRAGWRRPFRQDGAQRHRVRRDGRLCRGIGHSQGGQCRQEAGRVDAETTPLRDPEHYQYDFNLPDIAEVWRRGSVIASWLLDLSAAALIEDPDLRNSRAGSPTPAKAAGRSRPRSTKGVPAHVLSAALYERFSSRGEADFADKLLSAMRYEFGGHLEKPPRGRSGDRSAMPEREFEAMTEEELDQLAINTIRTLSIDAVQQAKSGHPGTPMALAPLVYTIWNRVMRFDPKDPIWPNRDRFVLSNGHASMLLWSVLHLTGTQAVNADYERLGKPSVTLDDIRHFRQLDSKAPGHPEYHWVSGVEATTGPLGQGIATSVGMAIARKWLAARYNRPGFEIFDYDIYAVCGDGCLMEGVGSEAASLAGHLGLDDLCWIYDNNHITIEGNTRITFTEDVAARFLGYRWNVLRVGDANDLERIEDALAVFRKTKGRPTLIILDSHIGYGSPAQARYRRGPWRAARRGGGPAHQARLWLAGGREVPRARWRHGAFRRRHRRARRRGAAPLGSALRRLSRAVPGARCRDRPDAAARAAGEMGPRPAELPARSQGHRRARCLGRGAERRSPRTFPGCSAARRTLGPRTRRR